MLESMDTAKVEGVEIVLPVDFVCSSKFGESETIIWNGPVGVFEMASFEKGAKAMMDMIVKVTLNGATTVISGGETAAAWKKYGTEDKLSLCSTSVGASWSAWRATFCPKSRRSTVRGCP